MIGKSIGGGVPCAVYGFSEEVLNAWPRWCQPTCWAQHWL
jgi:glutamate-1-semialdehyde aminotransferase